MKWMISIMCCMVILLVAAVSASADIPQIIPYQGILVRQTGEAYNGTHNLTLRFYDAPTQGSQIWVEEQPSVQVNRGIFAIMLGRYASLSTVDFNRPLWLGVTVGQGQELTPRVELAPVGTVFMARTVPDGSLTRAKIPPGQVATSVHGLKDQIQIVGEISIEVVVDGNRITIRKP